MKVIYSNWVLKSKYFQIEQWNMFQNVLEYNNKTFTIVGCFYLKFLSSSSERHWNHSMPHHDCDISIWHPFGTDWACAEKSKCLFWSNTPWPRAAPRVANNTNTKNTNTKVFPSVLIQDCLATCCPPPRAPNTPISTDLWAHFSYCVTFHSHIVKFRLYENRYKMNKQNIGA